MFRKGAIVLFTLAASLALLSTPAAARPFPETGYSVDNPKFLDYFDHRGGARVLGFPISREFDFLGTRVQFFQRAVLQLRPDGSVALLNILDEGLLPYTHINGSTFPAPDQALIQAAPSPSDPNYGSRAIDFVKAMAPDSWEGLNTNFYSTFLNTVTLQDAFPNGGDPALLPLMDLEIWGLPTSKPAYDPNNGNFVYLRFQRGIMHFDKTTGLTQGILIGDYLKSVITGQNLPTDLDQQARSSKLYRQYNNGAPSGINRPSDLPATNLFAAFEKDGVVPVPAPTTTPTPPPAPTATLAPAAQPTPTTIAISGSPWFVEQTQLALRKLQVGSPANYNLVRQYVFRIEASSTDSIDFPNRTFHITEAAAFPSNWRMSTDNQAEWYAGLLVHNATHIEQYVNGRPYMGAQAELEARLNQKDALSAIETDQPGMQFTNLITDLLNKVVYSWGEWEAPRDPLPTPTPVPTSS